MFYVKFCIINNIYVNLTIMNYVTKVFIFLNLRNKIKYIILCFDIDYLKEKKNCLDQMKQKL